MSQLAVPWLPYGRQCIDDEDIAAVVDVLRSDWLTTGPKVAEFEKAFAKAVGSQHAVAVSSGTAALHAAMHAISIRPGDEVIVPALTFVASANAVLFEGGTPVFADVDRARLLLDPGQVAAKISGQTKAVIAVDYAGHPCDYEALAAVCSRHGIAIVADACHSLGGQYRGRPVGSLALLNAFSLHPVKLVTTGEGGVVTTEDAELAGRMRAFRNHGIGRDHRQREEAGTWFYEMHELGYNYRLTDFQCALGISQLRRLSAWIARRRQLADRYDAALRTVPGVAPLGVSPEADHAYHLYVIRLEAPLGAAQRAHVFQSLRSDGIGVNVHYLPIHLHRYYRERFGTGPGLCPVAEDAYERMLSLPLFPAMTDRDVDRVVTSLKSALDVTPSSR